MYSTAMANDAIRLWRGEAPGALGDRLEDIPTITPFLLPPDQATGAAFVVFPGGGYATITAHEGEPYARWLNSHGIMAFVVKYRLASSGYRHPTMLLDGQRAMRFVRSNSSEWGIDPERIGVIGSSAGGHLAAMLLTCPNSGSPNAQDPLDRVDGRPNLGVLCYPVITMGPDTHPGVRRNLLGENPSPESRRELSAELQVNSETPPCFLFHSWEDGAVKAENSLLFAAALRRSSIPFEFHLPELGRHGLGLGGDPEVPASLHPWTQDCIRWLEHHHYAR